jgi:hypothetical protein
MGWTFRDGRPSSIARPGRIVAVYGAWHIRLSRPAARRRFAVEVTYEIGILGVFVLILGALVVGVIAQSIGDVRTGYDWFVVGLAAFVGGFVASEWIVAWQAFGPVWEGLAIVPAIVGGLVIAVLADAIVRYLNQGSYTRHVTA